MLEWVHTSISQKKWGLSLFSNPQQSWNHYCKVESQSSLVLFYSWDVTFRSFDGDPGCSQRCSAWWALQFNLSLLNSIGLRNILLYLQVFATYLFILSFKHSFIIQQTCWRENWLYVGGPYSPNFCLSSFIELHKCSQRTAMYQPPSQGRFWILSLFFTPRTYRSP